MTDPQTPTRRPPGRPLVRPFSRPAETAASPAGAEVAPARPVRRAPLVFTPPDAMPAVRPTPEALATEEFAPAEVGTATHPAAPGGIAPTTEPAIASGDPARHAVSVSVPEGHGARAPEWSAEEPVGETVAGLLAEIEPAVEPEPAAHERPHGEPGAGGATSSAPGEAEELEQLKEIEPWAVAATNAPVARRSEAVAEALERIATRLRAGEVVLPEVELPSGATGTSDAAALAIALTAVLSSSPR